MTAGFDDEVMRFLLAGKKPRFRRQEMFRRKEWTELDGADGLESEFQHLLWFFGERFTTIEEARLAEFDWATLLLIGYDDLAQWILQGASLHDKVLLGSLARAGINARQTAKRWRSDSQGTVTIMQALLWQHASVDEVVDLVRSKLLAG